MKKEFLIIKNHFNISLNKFIFGNKSNKKNISSLIFNLIIGFFLGVIIFCIGLLVSIFVINIFLDKIMYLSYQEKINYFSVVLFMFLLNCTFENLQSNVLRFLHSRDYLFLVTSPIKAGELLIGKLADRYILKNILRLILLIPLLLLLFLNLNLDVITIFYCFILTFILLIFSFVIRMYVLLHLVKTKLLNRRSYQYVLLKLFILISSVFSLIYLMIPFKTILFNNQVNMFINKVLNFEFIQECFNLLTSKFTFHYGISLSLFEIENQNYYFPITFLLCIFLFSLLMIVLVKRSFSKINLLEFTNLISNYQQVKYDQNVHIKIEITPGFSLIFKLFPKKVRIILVKDFKNFIRDRQYYWIYRISVILIGYLFIFFSFYLIDRFVGGFTFNKTYVGFLLAIYGVSLTISNLIDRFGIDAEGNNFIILKLSPVRASQILLAKMGGLILFTVPFSIIFCIVSLFVFKTNLLLLLLVVIFSVPTLSIIFISASSVFPNFNYESLLDLPSTNAKFIGTFLGVTYLSIVGSLIYYIDSFLIFSGVFLVFNILLSFLLFRISCKKIESSNMESFESYRSIIE
ncbi:hypothetical protein [Bacillus toyonensis]|uniref:Uncharacterized protein n=1 Tax=Bacillus toyonensis TaxID=155322 RepID=A0AAP8JX15_9BACI|nr:hypothetical protein [Bacillus toyonensis]PEB89943.1 hypothetical protein CON81_27920 [Bacillus toyonensis]PHE11411.1 hypothetical protein COF62_16315 [Bacillus toyonensis]